MLDIQIISQITQFWPSYLYDGNLYTGKNGRYIQAGG